MGHSNLPRKTHGNDHCWWIIPADSRLPVVHVGTHRDTHRACHSPALLTQPNTPGGCRKVAERRWQSMGCRLSGEGARMKGVG